MRRWAYRVRPLPMRSRGSTTSSPCSITPTGTRATRRPKRSCRRLTLPTPYGLPTQDLFFLSFFFMCEPSQPLSHLRRRNRCSRTRTRGGSTISSDRRRSMGPAVAASRASTPTTSRWTCATSSRASSRASVAVAAGCASLLLFFLSCDIFVVDTHHLVVPPTTEG